MSILTDQNAVEQTSFEIACDILRCQRDRAKDRLKAEMTQLDFEHIQAVEDYVNRFPDRPDSAIIVL